MQSSISKVERSVSIQYFLPSVIYGVQNLVPQNLIGDQEYAYPLEAH